MLQWERSALGNGRVAELERGDDEIEEELHQRLIRELDETALRALDAARARDLVERAARVLATEMFPRLVGDAKEEVVTHVVDEVLGLGPIEPLLNDPS